MLKAARTVPNEWGEHVKFAGTPPGLGIHALNLDADVGPWLQVLKLKALKDEAAAAGRESLAGSEIELMNLAGPRTGLEMMMPVAHNMPTANFFSEGGYYRNTIVREKTAAELLRRAQRPHGGQYQEAGRGRVRADLRRGGEAVAPATLALWGSRQFRAATAMLAPMKIACAARNAKESEMKRRILVAPDNALRPIFASKWQSGG